jgi:hypothetical protein
MIRLNTDGSVGILRNAIWDAEHGVRTLASALEASGVAVSEGMATTVFGVSGDGKTWVGGGTKGTTMAWIARLP